MGLGSYRYHKGSCGKGATPPGSLRSPGGQARDSTSQTSGAAVRMSRGANPPEELGIRVFDPLLPGLRVPLPAGEGGGHRLGFDSEAQRRDAGRACERDVAAQCERGARSSCVLAAVRHCKPSALHQLRARLVRLLPGSGHGDEGSSGCSHAEREACEDAYVARCTQEAVERCRRHGEDFCARVYSAVPVGSPPPPR